MAHPLESVNDASVHTRKGTSQGDTRTKHSNSLPPEADGERSAKGRDTLFRYGTA
jgi:hypothetical protein